MNFAIFGVVLVVGLALNAWVVTRLVERSTQAVAELGRALVNPSVEVASPAPAPDHSDNAQEALLLPWETWGTVEPPADAGSRPTGS